MTPCCQLGVSSCFFPPYVSWVGGVLELTASTWSPSNETDRQRSLAHARVNSPLLYTNTENLFPYANLRCIPVLHKFSRTVSISKAAFQRNPFYLLLLPQAATHGLLSKTKWNWWDYTDGHSTHGKSHLNGQLFKSMSSPCVVTLIHHVSGVTS